MGKISNRDKILSEGLKVVLQRGYVGASVRDIVEAAGVPQGSFTNHFKSKEAFALEILDLYYENVCATTDATLRNEDIAPLKRLRAYVDANIEAVSVRDVKNGCLIGNFSAEACDHSDSIRTRLREIYRELAEAVQNCLKAAVKAGELSKNFKCEEMAEFIVGGLQGAILLAKTQGDPAPLKNFRKTLFGIILT